MVVKQQWHSKLEWNGRVSYEKDAALCQVCCIEGCKRKHKMQIFACISYEPILVFMKSSCSLFCTVDAKLHLQHPFLLILE